MSDDSNDSIEPVGYRNPPKRHQFKKGQSGNPKGRPRKIDRTVLPDQLTRDTLAMANLPVRIKRKGKEIEISTYQALLLKMRAKALDGHEPSVREFLRRADLATGAFVEENKKDIVLYEMFNQHVRGSLTNPSKYSVDQLNAFTHAIKKSLES